MIHNVKRDLNDISGYFSCSKVMGFLFFSFSYFDEMVEKLQVLHDFHVFYIVLQFYIIKEELFIFNFTKK